MDVTFKQLVKRMQNKGNNLAETAVGRMMDIVYEDTGTYPEWTDKAPEWVVKNCIGGTK